MIRQHYSTLYSHLVAWCNVWPADDELSGRSLKANLKRIILKRGVHRSPTLLSNGTKGSIIHLQEHFLWVLFPVGGYDGESTLPAMRWRLLLGNPGRVGGLLGLVVCWLLGLSLVCPCHRGRLTD
jgi:hypothetical protein